MQSRVGKSSPRALDANDGDARSAEHCVGILIVGALAIDFDDANHGANRGHHLLVAQQLEWHNTGLVDLPTAPPHQTDDRSISRRRRMGVLAIGDSEVARLAAKLSELLVLAPGDVLH